MSEIERRLEEMRMVKLANLAAIPPMTRREAYDRGYYTFEVPPGPTGNWTDEDWMRYVTFTVRLTD